MTDIMVIGARGIPDAEGGAEKHAEMTFPYFAKSGYEVMLLGIKRYIRTKEFRGIRLRAVPTFNIANTDKLVYHFLAFLIAAFRRPRLVHLQGLNSAIFLVLYKLVGLKVVLRYGSTDHLHAKWGFLGRLSFRLCDMQVRFADRVITVSDIYKRQLQQTYNLRRVDIVPNGVDPALVTDEARRYWDGLGLTKGRYVLAVGRLTVDKDYDTLVRAMELLKDTDVKLVVAGGASEAEYASRLFALNGDRIKFIGRVERRLLAGLYEHCGVFVNSSHHEGLSNAVLEAVSYRRPLVVSDIPANAEMGLPTCCYFRKGDAESLAQKIAAALKTPAEYTARVDQFCSWREVFERTERIYLSILPMLQSARVPQSAP
jgi:glycosyltransferase involved in cell wall biosynthesis